MKIKWVFHSNVWYFSSTYMSIRVSQHYTTWSDHVQMYRGKNKSNFSFSLTLSVALSHRHFFPMTTFVIDNKSVYNGFFHDFWLEILVNILIEFNVLSKCSTMQNQFICSSFLHSYSECTNTTTRSLSYLYRLKTYIHEYEYEAHIESHEKKNTETNQRY